MCFSPAASFTASAVLGTAGVASLKQAKKNERPLAVIPLLFAIQQFFEGVVWLTFGHEIIQKIAAFFFLIFAEVFWPTYIPIAALVMEKEQRRRKALKFLLAAGILMSLFLLFSNIFLYNLDPSIAGHSIHYGFSSFRSNFHLNNHLIGGIYTLIVLGAGITSSNRGMNMFTVLVTLAAMVAYHLYQLTYVSVWCFFAAALSFSIYLYIGHHKDKKFAFFR